MIELEKTYLAKFIPGGLKDKKEMLDIFIPKNSVHPILRIRKNGEQFEITKKYPVEDGDASKQHEFTIKLTKEEFEELSLIEGKRTEKHRYKLDHQGREAEVDIFQGKLKGLVLIDFEFKTEEEKEIFEMPDFCLAEVTQEEFLAGGMLCGKSYEEVEENLNRFGYKKID